MCRPTSYHFFCLVLPPQMADTEDTFQDAALRAALAEAEEEDEEEEMAEARHVGCLRADA